MTDMTMTNINIEDAEYISSKAIDMTCDDLAIRNQADALHQIIKEHQWMRRYIGNLMGDPEFTFCPQGHIMGMMDEGCDICDPQDWGRTL